MKLMELAGEVNVQYIYRKDAFLCRENGCLMLSKQQRDRQDRWPAATVQENNSSVIEVRRWGGGKFRLVEFGYEGQKNGICIQNAS